ncbi:AMP-binding enzyme [Corynebacterium mustelae]|uniref:AMP-binding enzyme n=2 Tax=Corynebacterium mustelae TaxID=571915 RepID=A0A0G3H383_9CORY|nr:AMP-binding enzyme [Corynebacterium mustelae]
MRLERDYLELLVDNYLNQELDSIIAESQSSQTTIRDLSAKISEATAHMGKYNLSPSAFIVIRGVNSANLLAWILAAIKKRVPFCIESNDIKQADSVSAQLSEYGNVLVVELGSNSGNLSYITKKNQCKDFGNREWVYVVKTSGSTGVPKIIPISRSNLSSMLFAANEKLTLVSGETWLWEHRPSFDLALWEIFGCVLFKGKFIISPTPIAEWSVVEYRKIAEFSPQNITLTPSELKKIGQLDAATSQQFFEDARSILFCGERLGWDALRHLPSNVTPDEVQIYNAYGPSEATIFCSVHLLTSQDMALSSVPIGDPMGDMCLRVNISSGELFLSGSQVFEGYLGDGIVKTDEYATGDIVEKKRNR